MRRLAADVVPSDSHALNVPPSGTAFAKFWHLVSAPLRPPSAPLELVELKKTRFGIMVVTAHGMVAVRPTFRFAVKVVPGTAAEVMRN